MGLNPNRLDSSVNEEAKYKLIFRNFLFLKEIVASNLLPIFSQSTHKELVFVGIAHLNSAIPSEREKMREVSYK
jgi:hypothetical protein